MPDLDAFTSQESRLLEQAADEIARLDTFCTLSSAAAAIACRLAALAAATEGTPRALHSLVAAHADAAHEGSLDAPLRAQRDFCAEEERRARSGAPLSATRFVAAGYAVADARALDDALRAGGQPRPALVRACAAAAALWSDRETVSESTAQAMPSVAAALLLCAAGITDQLRLLPFIYLKPLDTHDAIDAWRAGSHEPWLTLALSESARAARALRLALADGVANERANVARLDALGRAAISARSALEYLRDHLAASVPRLSDALNLSRPAAGAALERLVAVGLAVEVTGRARDRVFALTSAFDAVVT